MSAAAHTVDVDASDIASEMETLAANGEWSSVAVLSQRLRDAVLRVPQEKREEMILALQRSNALIESLANHARDDIQGQITSIRRGQSAAEAYHLTDKLATG